MFPNIISHDRKSARCHWTVLVGCTCNLKLAVVGENKPHPATAKLFGTSIIEPLLEGFKVAEVILDNVSDWASRFTTGVGSHDLPKHRVVDMSTAVVTYCAFNVCWDTIKSND